ncbi:hypothetical protein [Clostridium baratii]|uniref:hypothetical protein n=1 Tax=Clostridium baratii TaxID=1561 RepID=UPI0005F2DAEA|nr:hypothetical protein [Clostridium baratii]AQM58541.1 hypothetical protein NPD11_3090 [Clostridium baratii]KJU72403.1 hypothetical protein UC77_04540 [Clostridium baratii]
MAKLTSRLNVFISDKADKFLKEFPLKKRFKQEQVTSYIEAFGNQLAFATKNLEEVLSKEDIIKISNFFDFDCFSANFSSKQFFRFGIENLSFLGNTDFINIKSTKQPDKTLADIINELTEFSSFALILECFKYIGKPYNTNSEKNHSDEKVLSAEDLKNKYNK